MNQNIAQGSWTEIKGKIKSRFAKFTDDDLESFKGNLEQISGKIQKVYGYAQDRAEKEFNELKASLNDSKSESKSEYNTPATSKASISPIHPNVKM